VFEFIAIWYDRQRRLSTLGYRTPAEYEATLALRCWPGTRDPTVSATCSVRFCTKGVVGIVDQALGQVRDYEATVIPERRIAQTR